MTDEIYTIPVREGFDENSECPFCSMRQKLEEKTVAYFLSPAYMEEEIREETNEKGFCNPHLKKLYASRNALGVSLMMQSMTNKRRTDLQTLLAKCDKEKNKARREQAFASYQATLDDCCICTRIKNTMERYTEAFFMLWKKDEEIRKQVAEGKGFCLEHFLTLYLAAEHNLFGSTASDFKQLLCTVEEKELARVQEDLDWFVRKFDYRFANEPWKNSKDALPRDILKMNGFFPEE